jgi:hypothetical protein
MAEVRLPYNRETKTCTTPIPAACVRCGGPPAVSKVRTLTWRPPWVWTTLAATPFLSILPFLIVVFVAGRKVRLAVPFCERHRWEWIWRGWTAGLAWTAVLLSLPPLIGATVGGVVVWLALMAGACVLSASLRLTEVRARSFDDGSFELVNVAPEFVAALGSCRGCARCGYDLRGNTSGRCPECGLSVEQPPQQPLA